MASQLSAGSNLLFMVGTLEAESGPYREIMPEHLFLGGCKLTDLEDTEFPQLAEAAKVPVDGTRMGEEGWFNFPCFGAGRWHSPRTAG